MPAARWLGDRWALAWAHVLLGGERNAACGCGGGRRGALRTARQLVAAALAITLGMIEPQIALPALVGSFIGFRSIRLPLAVALLSLSAISMLSGGVAHNLAYFTTVLPAHALSEVSRDNQYSLSTVVAAFGVPDRAAVLAGSAAYLVMLGLGVAVGLALARRYAEPAFVPLVPCAFALLGGSFVHTEAIAAAVPPALLLYVRALANIAAGFSLRWYCWRCRGCMRRRRHSFSRRSIRSPIWRTCSGAAIGRPAQPLDLQPPQRSSVCLLWQSLLAMSSPAFIPIHRSIRGSLRRAGGVSCFAIRRIDSSRGSCACRRGQGLSAW